MRAHNSGMSLDRLNPILWRWVRSSAPNARIGEGRLSRASLRDIDDRPTITETHRRSLRAPVVTGKARLSYRQDERIFSKASGGETLHQLRHSEISRLAEAGQDITMIKSKSRHGSLRPLERYANQSLAQYDPRTRLPSLPESSLSGCLAGTAGHRSTEPVRTPSPFLRRTP